MNGYMVIYIYIYIYRDDYIYIYIVIHMCCFPMHQCRDGCVMELTMVWGPTHHSFNEVIGTYSGLFLESG